jgi:hypothetical protein
MGCTAAYGYSSIKQGVSEELVDESISDEIIWSLYAGLDKHLGYVILMLSVLENNSSVTQLSIHAWHGHGWTDMRGEQTLKSTHLISFSPSRRPSRFP